ncbi:ABC transporter substrate-binding protein [candidate division WOR-3 bacterium]|nr:ABC transporter substrate-binding protein [candidate division WOR-3 bacterium]
MTREKSLSVFAVSLLPWFMVFCLFSCRDGSAKEKNEKNYDRIIILGPNLVQIVSSLGFSEKIVGIDSWSDKSLARKDAARVGGILDPNLELITLLEPDLVLVAGDPTRLNDFLSEYSVKTIGFSVEDTQDILNAISEISSLLSAEGEGLKLSEKIRQELRAISPSGFIPRPKVLLAITSDVSSPENFMSASSETFLGEIIGIAGGENAVGVNAVLYPEISKEAVLLLDPDIIIEFRPTNTPEKYDSLSLVSRWEKVYPGIKAVRRGCVHICFDEKILIPGPGFPESAQFLHLFIQRAVDAED